MSDQVTTQTPETLARPEPRAGEHYRHYQYGLVEVVGISRHARSMERVVVYRYLPPWQPSGVLLQHRSVHEFLGKVTDAVERFAREE